MMPLKETAKKNFINVLSKENLDIDLLSLSDKELKTLYVKWMKLRQGVEFKYQAPKKGDFEEALKTGKMPFVTFRGTPGVRTMTLKEYLRMEEFVENNKSVYPNFQKIE